MLRGIAALGVVAHHVFILLHERRIDRTLDWVGGAAGVDIFFPISGFVMVVSTYRSWGRPEENRDFFLRRLIRIVPLYWLLTTLKLGLLAAFPVFALRGTLELWHTAASYLFLPATNVTTGQTTPLLPVGWTLNLEMFFYALFAIALVFARHPLRYTLTVLLAIGLIGLLSLEVWPPIQFYTDPIIMEFAFGMMVGWLVIRGFKFSPRAAWILALLALAVMISAEYAPGFSPQWRIYVWGIPGAVLLMAMISLEGHLNRLIFRRTALLIGDASYAIYLSHGFVLTAVGLWCSRLGYTGLSATFGVLGLCLVLAIGVGILLHRFIEVPLGRFLNAHLVPKNPRPASP